MTGQSRETLTMNETMFKKSSNRTVILGVVAALMTIATIVLAVLYGISVSSTDPVPPPVVTTPSSGQAICETQDCITAASRILNAMDQDAKPCDDFFEYACGTWNRDHIIADDQSSVSTFNGLRDDVSKVLKRVLEGDSRPDSESITKAKEFYLSCMNTTLIDDRGLDPVLNLISEMGGWPVIGNTFVATNFKFEETLGKFISEFDTSAILSSWVSADDKNSSVNIIQIDQPRLGMPGRDYYLSEETRKWVEPAYRDYMTNMMKMVGGTGANETKIQEVVEEIIQLETDLAEAMAPNSERRDSVAIYNKLSIAEVSSSINNNFDWTAYLNSFLNITSDSLTVDESEDVVVYAKEYIRNVTAIINGRWELVQNYLVWRVLKDRTSYMSSELRSTRAPYTQATSGTSSEEARYMGCSDTATNYFPMPVGALFVEENFSEDNKDAMVQMVEDLRMVFKEMLPSNDWMDQPTKDAAAEKADLITPIIAYPDYILEENSKQMDDEYKSASVGLDTYFENIQNMRLFETKNYLDKLRKPVDFEEWITSPAIVNAFYSPSRNQIVFPAGILQPPFFDKGQPMSMNYGAIGMVIGHEVTHGFDDSGAQFDGHGNLNNWWTNTSQEQFDIRAQCMVDQYSAIEWPTADNNHIDGKLTLGENIADNGGLRQAFGAYKKWQKDHPEGDLRLPGLGSFTQEQLLFIGYAQVWCGTYTPEYAVQMLKTDSHSPGIYRVQIPSLNFPEFGESFNCVKGEDPMYPEEKDTCRVW